MLFLFLSLVYCWNIWLLEYDVRIHPRQADVFIVANARRRYCSRRQVINRIIKMYLNCVFGRCKTKRSLMFRQEMYFFYGKYPKFFSTMRVGGIETTADRYTLCVFRVEILIRFFDFVYKFVLVGGITSTGATHGDDHRGRRRSRIHKDPRLLWMWRERAST